jgi:HEAT repeat protein
MRTLPASTDYDGWVAQLARSGRRQEARRRLYESGPPAVPAIRRGLTHPAPMVRRLCASILDRLVDQESVPALVAALDDPDADVVKRALHALACDQCKENECRPGEEHFVPKALTLLDHPNADIRAGAIDALGKVAARRPDVVAALAAVSERDADRGLRGMARQIVVRAG